MSATATMDLPLEAIREYCATQPIQRLSLIDSAARNELTPDSDVDLLVEYDPDASVGLFEMGGRLMDFQDIVGRKVDLVTPNGLCKYIRDEVLESARLILCHWRASMTRFDRNIFWIRRMSAGRLVRSTCNGRDPC